MVLLKSDKISFVYPIPRSALTPSVTSEPLNWAGGHKKTPNIYQLREWQSVSTSRNADSKTPTLSSKRSNPLSRKKTPKIWKHEAHAGNSNQNPPSLRQSDLEHLFASRVLVSAEKFVTMPKNPLFQATLAAASAGTALRRQVPRMPP